MRQAHISAAMNRFLRSTGLNYPYFIRISLVRKWFHSKCFFSITATFWNSFLRGCFTANFNLNLLSLRPIVIYPPYSSLVTFSMYVHIANYILYSSTLSASRELYRLNIIKKRKINSFQATP